MPRGRCRWTSRRRRDPPAFAPTRRTSRTSATTDHVVVPANQLREGRNEITVEFVAGDAALNRNPEFLYTLFVPARAHLTFPCFDQPDLKARCSLHLEFPAGWEAVANGAETSRDGGRRTARRSFAETEPLSTYLFAFAAGRFQVETAERSGRTFRMLHRETDAAKVARNREAVFDLHASRSPGSSSTPASRTRGANSTSCSSRRFSSAAWSTPGAIFYNAAGLLLDPSATQNQKLGRASVIAHETAHMWFGDLVTMRWFNDVWMKEVFANFMAAKIVNPTFPEINHDLRFLLAHYPAAYDVDRTPGTNAIRQRLDNLNEAGSLYGAIIYQKAPIVMRQLETILGEDVVSRRTAGVPAPASLRQRDLDRPDHAARCQNARRDLAGWSRAWVEEAGRPIVATELRVEDGRIAKLAFHQRDPLLRRGLVWIQRMRVRAWITRGAPHDFRAPARRERRRVGSARARRAAFVLPSGNGVGYARFELDSASLSYLTPAFRRYPTR